MQPAKQSRKPAARRLSLCLLNKHDPDRRAAKWDGTHYVSRCLKCGSRIRRKAHNDWRQDWLRNRRGGKSARTESVLTS